MYREERSNLKNIPLIIPVIDEIQTIENNYKNNLHLPYNS